MSAIFWLSFFVLRDTFTEIADKFETSPSGAPKKSIENLAEMAFYVKEFGLVTFVLD